jgi:hypothetical protein
MGGGKGSSAAPPPIDPGKSMGEYLFGKGFTKLPRYYRPSIAGTLIGRRSYVSTTIHSIRAC